MDQSASSREGRHGNTGHLARIRDKLDTESVEAEAPKPCLWWSWRDGSVVRGSC